LKIGAAFENYIAGIAVDSEAGFGNKRAARPWVGEEELTLLGKSDLQSCDSEPRKYCWIA